MRRLTAWTGLALALGASAALPLRAQNSCPGCANRPPAAPVRIEVETRFDFGTAAQSPAGNGAIDIDERTGARRVTGGLVAVGTLALRGTVRISGDPLRMVRIDLPRSAVMISNLGHRADIVGIKSDSPPVLRLDASGRASFNFGGTLEVRNGARGDFTGRIPVTADYL